MSFQTLHTLSLSPTGTKRKTGNLQEKNAVCLSFIRTKRHGECESEAWEDWKQTPGQGQLRIFLCKKNNQFSCIKNPKPTEISREFPSANIRRLRHRRRLAEFFSMRIKKSGRNSIRKNCPREAFNLPLNYRLPI